MDRHYLACFIRKDPPQLRFKPLAEAEQLWQEAERAARKDSELLARVRVSHLPVRYAFLSRWGALRRECREQNGDWPLAKSRKFVADEFRQAGAGVPGKPWTHVGVLNERGLSVDEFLKPFAVDPPEENTQRPPKRVKHPDQELTGSQDSLILEAWPQRTPSSVWPGVRSP